MSVREKPVCVAVRPWIRHHCGRDALAPLTGQDWRAYQAWMHVIDLYAVSDTQGRLQALVAMRALLGAVQPSVRHILWASVPHVMDWGDTERLQALVASVAP